MSENTKLGPKRRFRDFDNTGAWEQRKVANIFKVTRGYVLAATKTSEGQTKETPYPVYSSQTKDNGLMGYYTDYLYEDAITWTTDGANAGTVKYRGGKFYCTNVCGVLLSDQVRANQMIAEALNNISKKYVSYVGNPKLMNNVMSDIQINLPKQENEREQISEFFVKLDNLITLHQRKIEKMKAMKSAYLSEMFPLEGEPEPRRRFAGFTDPWKQRKLGELYQKIRNAFVGTATPYYVDEGHFYLESNNVKDGQINRNTEIFINDEFYERQKDNWLHTNDLVMVQSGHVGHSAVIPENLDNTAAHALIIIANPNEKINPHFVNYQFQTKKAKHDIDNITTGNTIKHILSSEMKKFEISVCDYAEQIQIGTFFENLDNLIIHQQRKLEKLQSIKKAYLNEMFI